jgi:hypothetical protein
MTPEEAFEQLHARLRRYRLDTALANLAAFQLMYADEEQYAQLPKRMQNLWPTTINPHQFPYLAKALISAGGNDHRSQELTFDEYVELARLYNHAQAVDRTGFRDISDAELFLTRISEQQFRYQQWPYPQVARTLLLFSDLARDPKHARKFDIPTAFEDLTGLSVEQFVMIGVAIWGLVSAGGMRTFDAASLVEKNRHMFSHDIMARFLARTAADYAGFRGNCSKHPPPRRALTFYAFNPLEVAPIIKTQRSGYVVPRLLLDRVTLGIYHDLLGEYGSAFTNVFGDVFEEYVGELLGSVYDETELLPQRPYGRGRNPGDRTTDWIVVEGSIGTLLECKSTRLTLPTKVSADPELVEADLAKGVVKAARQLARVMSDIRAGRNHLEDLQRLETLVPAVVTLDPYFTGNSATFRKLVNDQLSACGIEPFDYQVIGVHEFERFIHPVRERGLGKLLLEKMADKGQPWDSKAYWLFETYVAEAAPDTPRPRLPLLEERWRRLVKAMLPEESELGLDAIFADDERDDARATMPR